MDESPSSFASSDFPPGTPFVDITSQLVLASTLTPTRSRSIYSHDVPQTHTPLGLRAKSDILDGHLNGDLPKDYSQECEADKRPNTKPTADVTFGQSEESSESRKKEILRVKASLPYVSVVRCGMKEECPVTPSASSKVPRKRFNQEVSHWRQCVKRLARVYDL